MARGRGTGIALFLSPLSFRHGTRRTRTGRYVMTRHDPDLEWLLAKAKGDRQKALFVYWLEAGVDKAEAAREADYSAGRSDDPARQRKALQTSASSALKTERVQWLADEYRRYKRRVRGRNDDEPAPIASANEVLQRLTEVMRKSNDAKVVSAARRLLEYHEESGRPVVTRESVVRLFVGRVGPKNARHGIEALGAGHLLNALPADLEARLTRLERDVENEHERAERKGPVAGSSDPGAGVVGGRGLSEHRTEASPEMGAGRADVGEPAGDRREGEAGERDAGGKVTEDDQAAMQEFQRSIGL